MEPALKSADYRMDMVAHPFKKCFAIQQVTLIIPVYPSRCLAVPHEGVPHHMHPVLFAKLNKAVRRPEIVLTGPGVDMLPFCNILRCDGIEMLLYEPHSIDIFLIDLTAIKGRTYHKGIPVNILQPER